MSDFQPTSASVIWHLGDKTYYSNNTDQYQLINNKYWQAVKWTGVQSFSASNIWCDTEDNTYLYTGNATYRLSGTTWEQVEMPLPNNFSANDVWHDHDRTFFTYASYNSTTTYLFENGKWVEHTLNSSPISGYASGRYKWHDTEGNTYQAIDWSQHYNNGKQQLKLVEDTWTPVTFETPVSSGKINCENAIVINGVLYTSAAAYSSSDMTYSIFAKFTGSAWEQSDFNNIIKRSTYTFYITPEKMWHDSAENWYYTNNFRQSSSAPNAYATYKLVGSEWQEVTFENPFESGMSYGKASRRYLDLDGLNTLGTVIRRYIYRLVQEASIPDSEVGVFRGMQEDISDLQKELAALKTDMAKVKQEVGSDLQSSINELKQSMQSLETKINNDTQSSLQSLRNDISSIQSTVNDLQSQNIDDLKQKVSSLETSVNKHETQLGGLTFTLE